MLNMQQRFITSRFSELYDIIIPKDNDYRRINELLDFGFIYDELVNKYSVDNGRTAIDPVMMFKYLLLKSITDLSDVDIVEHCKFNMAYKYFLGMAPEDDVIHPSSLTKFRKLRLQDINLLDMLIAKTVTVALEQGIIKSTSIIVDATHTKSRYNYRKPREVLQEYCKTLRKAVYKVDATMKEKFPPQNVDDDIEKEVEYCKKVIHMVKNDERFKYVINIKEKYNRLEEIVEDDVEQLEYIKNTNDEDAKIGHKTADSSFYGYKTHIAMAEERLITAAVVTSGEKNDGKQLKELYEKSKENGMEVTDIIGDAAYSERDNVKLAEEENINLVAKLHPSVSMGYRKKEDEFEFNKDAGLCVCKAGHMATRKSEVRYKSEKRNDHTTYYFDVSKCKSCPHKEGCYKEGAKTKTYNVTKKGPIHTKQMEFEKSDYFKEKSKERYKIEAKNSELKNRHGYDTASSSGLLGMQMQGAMAIFAVNLKRILKLTKENPTTK